MLNIDLKKIMNRKFVIRNFMCIS